MKERLKTTQFTTSETQKLVHKNDKHSFFGRTREKLESILSKSVSLYKNKINKKKYLQYNHFEVLKYEDYIKKGDKTPFSKKSQYSYEKNSIIKEKEVAIINLFGVPYVGRIISHNKEDENICYSKFIDNNGLIRSGYVKKDSVNPDKLFEEIRNRKGNLKEGDSVFIPYGEGIAVGTIIGKKKNRYKIGVGIVSKNGESIVDTIRKNATEINEYNEEIINELDGNNIPLYQNLKESPEIFNIGRFILLQPDENSPIFEGEVISGAENKRLVNVKYMDENGKIQERQFDKNKLKKINIKYRLSSRNYSEGKYVKIPFNRGIVLGKIIEKYGNNYYRVEIVNKLNIVIDLEEKDLDELNKPQNKVDNQE